MKDRKILKINNTMGLNNVILILLALFMALFIGGLFLFINGFSPIDVYGGILVGAFGSLPGFASTLRQSTPLIFTGLAFAVASKAGIMNVGLEGQLYMGALGAALAGAYIKGLPAFLHIPLALLAAILAGGIWGAVIAYLKVYFGSNEVVTSIMLNFVATNLIGYLVNYPLKAAESASPQTEPILDTARLPLIGNQYNVSSGILVAIIAVVVITIIYYKTPLGYEIKATGKNISATETAGIKSNRILILSMFISGAIAGLAGAGQVLGVNHRFIDNFSPGYGFEGVAVSALVANNPGLTMISGLFFGALKAGAITVNRIAQVPMDFISVIQALVVVFVAAPKLMTFFTRVFNNPKRGGLKNG